ncbi:hypothetical protein PybrP1_012910 [[Pythium] brassicae (nom. inval.)]|nr:hypothetical protein PybrP1_012910 [[Pythium] brassicae (nom. inval.)]
MLWVDNANIPRCRVVPRARFERAAFKLELTSALQSVPSTADVAFNPPVGVVELSPDRRDGAEPTLYDISAWMPDTRAAFGDMRQPGGAAWNLCPRTFLRRQERKLRAELGAHATIGFELEFQLLHGDADAPPLAPVDSSLYAEVRAFYPRGSAATAATASSWDVLRDIVECLQRDLGIAVFQYHPESASGQFEISIGYYDDGDATATAASGSAACGPGGSLVDAVDKLVLARLSVHGIAAKHGLRATFVPKLRMNEAGSGAHVHLGLVDAASGANLFAARTATASAFVAGILEALPGMLLLLASSGNSYERFQASCWAGAFCCYGFENREAPIRLIGASASLPANAMAGVDHFEVKSVDATANPYIAVGALLAAGMAGVRRGAVLPDPVQVDPAAASSDRTLPRLPESLSAAIAAFEQSWDELWNDALSPEYAALLVRLRKYEEAQSADLPREMRLAQLMKRF